MDDKSRILKSPTLKSLYELLPKAAEDQKKDLGQAINKLKVEVNSWVTSNADDDLRSNDTKNLQLDVTAPFDVNAKKPEFLKAEQGSIHPISKEIEKVSEIFNSIGFEIFESRNLDDAWHMFTSLNFPEDHPARDDYDTFVTEAEEGEELVAPAHTSTMQSRILSLRKGDLKEGRPIAAAVPDRCYRNEDVDARHEHTFYQVEGIYVDENVNVGNLIATLKTFLSAYYGKEVETRINPFYFPFTEPSFEFALSCPFCEKEGCHICSQSGWIELLGCGMIHPNVLEMAGIDSKKYSGFAFGCGIERLIMMKYGVEDVRLFHSAKLKFLKQF
ncbi:MAG: phenylalanyl-tRNA synthetase alpha chain [Patescibacteria group bacterium]|nr:phenylalanyl-tRNA synthetase alpha chain [Patescibacteria group bacterium]